MISAIIPARNEEASIRRAVDSLAEQPEIAEIIVVDDQSTDATPSVLANLASRIPKLKLIRAPEPPPGWTGKNHAVWLGAIAAHASADWLLFTDADTCHLPGSAARALADASFHSADLVSYSPDQELRSFWERALVPVVYWRLSQRFPFDRVNDARSADAAANGQFILVRREAYQAIGGHAAVASQILEDVALARRAKQAGFKLFFAPGQGIVETRMYRSFRAMWEGWTKNLYPLFGGTVAEMLFEIDSATPALGLLFAIAIGVRWATSGHIDWLVAMVAAILIARPLAGYHVWLRRNRYPDQHIKYFLFYYLFGAPLYAAALIASWWKNMRGSVAWKGRKYAQHA